MLCCTEAASPFKGLGRSLRRLRSIRPPADRPLFAAGGGQVGAGVLHCGEVATAHGRALQDKRKKSKGGTAVPATGQLLLQAGPTAVARPN